MNNPNCDGGKCIKPRGQIRTLPTDGSGNAILCHECYLHEMEFRRERNKELGTAAQFDLPRWKDLRVYEV